MPSYSMPGHDEIYGGTDGLRHHLCVHHGEHFDEGTPADEMEEAHEDGHLSRMYHSGEWGCEEHDPSEEPTELSEMQREGDIGPIHRGVGVHLPDELHRFVHDETKPASDRAEALIGHLRSHREGIGTHWTTEPRVAEDFAEKSARHLAAEDESGRRDSGDHSWGTDPEYGTPRGKPSTAVVLHAAEPEADNIDPTEAYATGGAYGWSEHGEREVPLRSGDYADITGVSWKQHDADWDGPHGDDEYTRSGFDGENHHTAAYTPKNSLPDEEQEGLYWRAHRRGEPFDAEHAWSHPVSSPGHTEVPAEQVQRGYSAFAHPYHLAQYMPQYFGETSNGRTVYAFHGREAGTGPDHEPLVVPEADHSCCGKVVHDQMPWHEFERRAWDTGHVPDYIEPGPWEQGSWKSWEHQGSKGAAAELLGHFEAAARPPRGQETCSCCQGRSEHADGTSCGRCEGGFTARGDRSPHCDGQKQKRRKGWRQGSLEPQEGYRNPFPARPGLFYRAHRKDQPLDEAHARSRPLVNPFNSPKEYPYSSQYYGEWAQQQVGRPGYSAFASPWHLATYLNRQGWSRGSEASEEQTGFRDRHIVAFHGTQAGRGVDNEPLVMPKADHSCCGRIIHGTTPWEEFSGTLEKAAEPFHGPYDDWSTMLANDKTPGGTSPWNARKDSPVRKSVQRNERARERRQASAGRYPVLAPGDMGRLTFTDFPGHDIAGVADELYRREPKYMAALEDDARSGGFAYPAEIAHHGRDEWEVSSGHHRMAAGYRAGVPVPYDRVAEYGDHGETREEWKHARQWSDRRRENPEEQLAYTRRGEADDPFGGKHLASRPPYQGQHHPLGHWTPVHVRGEGALPQFADPRRHVYAEGARETLAQFSRAAGNPDAPLRVYRAMPLHADGQINPGDWVSLGRLAPLHLAADRNYHDPDSLLTDPLPHDRRYHVWGATVPARHVSTDGNLMEYGYQGPRVRGEHLPECCADPAHPGSGPDDTGAIEAREEEVMPPRKAAFEYPLAPGALGQQGYRITDESRGYRAGSPWTGSPSESWARMHMTHPSGESHGYLDYSQVGGHDDPYRQVHVEDLQVPERHGRGIASALMDHLYSQHPEPAEITHSMRTDGPRGGAGWWDRYIGQRPEIAAREERQRAREDEDGLGFEASREAPEEAGAARPDPDATDWGEVLRQLRYRKKNEPEMHRGYAVTLPRDLEDFVTDRFQGRDRQARALADHLARNGLGTHWSSNPKVSREFAELGKNREPGTMKVIVHARLPEVGHIETDRSKLSEGAVYRHDEYLAGEREIPLKSDAPVRVTGVTWYGYRNRKIRGDIYGMEHTATVRPGGAREMIPGGQSPEEEWHGPYEVVKHPDTGRYHVVDNQGRYSSVLDEIKGFPDWDRASASRDYVDRRRAGKERMKGLADQLWSGGAEAIDPGSSRDTEEGRASDRNLQRGEELMGRYAGGRGTIRFDEDDRPYYERDHVLPGGRPSGWYVRHSGGSTAGVYHRAAGEDQQADLRLGDVGEHFGDEDLGRAMDAWHSEPDGMRRDLERQHPAIGSWKKQHLGSLEAQAASELTAHFEDPPIKAQASDYHLQHTAPSPEHGHLPLHHYTGGDPDEHVRIYRSAPAGTNEINPGDWISLNPDYAHRHGYDMGPGRSDWPVYTATVPQRQVHWDENDEDEHGYNGPSIPDPDIHEEESGAIRPLSDWEEDNPHGHEAHLGSAVHLPEAEHDFAHDSFEDEEDRANTLLDAARAQGALHSARWHADGYDASEAAHKRALDIRPPEGSKVTEFTVHRGDDGKIKDLSAKRHDPADDSAWRGWRTIDTEECYPDYSHPAIDEAGSSRTAALDDDEIRRGLGLPSAEEGQAQLRKEKTEDLKGKFDRLFLGDDASWEDYRLNKSNEYSMDLRRRYEGGSGTHGFEYNEDDKPGQPTGSPYYEIAHRDARGRDTGWRIRHRNDGPEAEILHAGTGSDVHEMIELPRPSYASNEPHDWFGHEHLSRILDGWHAGSLDPDEPDENRKYLEQNEPGIRRWQRRRLGAAEAETARPGYGRKPSPDWDSIRDIPDDDERSAAYDKALQSGRDWEDNIRRGLSLGHLSGHQAERLGYRFSGHEADDQRWEGLKSAWKPLPGELYHVTTDLDAVQRSGGLKSRRERNDYQATGLGGGDDGSVSLTTSHEYANHILRGLHEYHSFLNGGDPGRLLDRARRGDTAERPYHDTVIGMYRSGWKDGDPLPGNLSSILRGRRMERGTARSQEEMDERHGPGWVPHPEEAESFAGRNGAVFHYGWERPASPEEQLQDRSALYKYFAGARAYAGGLEDPMFMGNDPHKFAKTDPSQFAIMHVRPKDRAQGYHVSDAEHEWRTHSGDALETVRAEKPRPPERLARRTAASPEEYGIQHRPDTGGPPLHDLLDSSETDWGMPADYYERMHEYRMYSDDSFGEDEAMRKVRRFRGQPDRRVRVWRAAPAVNPESRNGKKGEINHGDWIALSRKKAVQEAQGENDPPSGSLPADHPRRYHIWSATVPAKHVRNADGDLTEWGYAGPDIKDIAHMSEICNHRARVKPQASLSRTALAVAPVTPAGIFQTAAEAASGSWDPDSPAEVLRSLGHMPELFGSLAVALEALAARMDGTPVDEEIPGMIRSMAASCRAAEEDSAQTVRDLEPGTA